MNTYEDDITILSDKVSRFLTRLLANGTIKKEISNDPSLAILLEDVESFFDLDD